MAKPKVWARRLGGSLGGKLVGEIDATEWEAEGEEALGTKPKVWLREPSSSTPWLFKHVTFNQTPTGS